MSHQFGNEVSLTATTTTTSSVAASHYITVACPTGLCSRSSSATLPDVRAYVRNISTASSSSTTAEDASIQICTYPRINSLTNRLCAACESGYLPWGLHCDECTQTNGGMLVAALLLVFAQVYFLLYNSETESHHISDGSSDVLIYFIQTAALQLTTVSSDLDWIALFNFGTTSTPSCIHLFLL